MRVLVLNGPNLGRLGRRQPEIYGHTTHTELAERCVAWGRELGLDVEVRQTNHEGVMIDWIQEVRHTADGVVINAGGWTHTSVAIRDALCNVEGTIVEVHITDIHAREDFRRHSFISDVADHVVVGHGVRGYVEAVDLVISREGVPRHH